LSIEFLAGATASGIDDGHRGRDSGSPSKSNMIPWYTALMADDEIDEFDPREAYPLLDETFGGPDGWNAPGIEGYDDYDVHRPGATGGGFGTPVSYRSD
jgi:hypothetical protein